MDQKDYLILLLFLVMIFVLSLLQERGVRIRESIAKKGIAVHAAFWVGAILFIVLFGAYGQGYLPVDPIYAKF